MNELRLPNPHEINFFKYFENRIDGLLSPFCVIPCRYDKDGCQVIADENVYALFKLESSYLNNPFKTFFESNSDKNSNRNYVERLFEVISEDTDFKDVVIGYYDNVVDDFVQLAYIENFYEKRLYGILDYAYSIALDAFYIDEDMLDKRVSHTINDINEMLEFKMTTKQMIYLINELKKSCIEGSFYTSYRDDILGMNHDISFLIQEILQEKNIVDGINLNQETILINYLKVLGVLEFYASRDSELFTPINNIGSSINDKIVIYIGFHPIFLDMLKSKY